MKKISDVIDYLKSLPDKDYLLLLSGGSSPYDLYTAIARDVDCPLPKDIALTDERWSLGTFHEHSNARMILDTGLLGRLEFEKAVWHPILTGLKDPKQEATRYNEELGKLVQKYNGKVIAIMAVSADGHTAGILPESKAIDSKDNVVYFEDYGQPQDYKDRITVTAHFIETYLSKVILLLSSEDRMKMFYKISSENDNVKYTSLIYKSMKNVDIVCTYL